VKQIVLISFLMQALMAVVAAQEILPVQEGPDYEILRRRQLQGDTTGGLPNFSMMVKPFEFTEATNRRPKENLRVLPLRQLTQFNSLRPLAWTDGAMLPSRGWQFYYSIGLELRAENLLVKFQPEYTWAFNEKFQGFPTDHYPIIWKYYYQWLNRIDQPEHFSAEPYYKFRPGQSRIQVMAKGIALGVSTENLWWGPGRYNSLLMTNAAPGFLHFTFHTDKPLQTPVGSFEWQLVWGGELKNSDEPTPENLRTYNNQLLYLQKLEKPRIFDGGILTWQPRWTKGLFLGVDLAQIRYKSDTTLKPAKMGSLFARFSLPQEKAEFYFQYGRSDKFASPFNLLRDTIPRGYLAGLRKLFTLNKKQSSFLQFGIELIQLQVPNASLIQQARSWYTHDVVRQGFTHEGQLLGATVGPGGNAQRVDISWVKKKARIGIELERWLHNADFYYNYNINSGSFDFNRQWVDLSASLVFNVPVKKWHWFGQFSMIRSLNYQWKSYIPTQVTAVNYFDNGWDEVNLHGRLGFIHQF
jgi:hypothetical protein